MPTERDLDTGREVNSNPLLQEAAVIISDQQRLLNLLDVTEVVDCAGAQKILQRGQELLGKAQSIETPSTIEELWFYEMQKRLQSETRNLEIMLQVKLPTLEDAIKIYGISESSLESVEPWLEANMAAAGEAVEKLGEVLPDYLQRTGKIRFDAPRVVDEVVTASSCIFDRYLDVLAGLPSAKNYPDLSCQLGAIRIEPIVTSSEPDSLSTSYNSFTDTAYLDMGKLFYYTQQGLGYDESLLLGHMGHEIYGHAAQFKVTAHHPGIPQFARIHTKATRSPVEAVAEFYEDVIYRDLEENLEDQRVLEIDGKFDEIRQVRDLRQTIRDYNRNLLIYAIVIIGSSKELSSSDTQESIAKAVKKYALNDFMAGSTLNTTFGHFTESGRFDYDVLEALKYSSSSLIENAMETFRENGINYETPKGRALIDTVFRTGSLTADSFQHKVRLAATGAWVPPEIA